MPEIGDESLKTAWIRQLRKDWKLANNTYFKDTMRLPNIELSVSERTLGRWKGGHEGTLFISIHLINSHPWGYVQEVLYHEMAHQYVEQILGILDEAPHGASFKNVCLKNGFDPSATGTLQAWLEKKNQHAAPDSKDHKMLNTINKLLALAQSTHEHEARSAMNKAHHLLLKHNLSLLDLKTERLYIHKQIGNVGRRNPGKSIISAILGKFFFVEALWVFGYDAKKDRSGRILEIYGSPENVELGEYVYDSLQNISDLRWRTHKRQEKIKGDKHRRTFIYGLLEGFYHKLEDGVIENRSNHLVWKGDPQLKTFFRRRNPKVVRVSSRYSRSAKEAYVSGLAQGKNLVIHKGISLKSVRKINRLN